MKRWWRIMRKSNLLFFAWNVKIGKEIRTCRILITNQQRLNQKDYPLQHVCREVVPSLKR